jgi:hypothetical protein
MIGYDMAGANLPAKKYKKTQPTLTRLSFECAGGTTQFIDIGKALSQINRKFYRAGVYYYVNSIEVYNNEQGVVDFHTLPDNWITKNAWNRGLKLFQKMNALAGPPLATGMKPKYHDFKVYMSNRHRTAGSLDPVLYDINSAGNPLSMGTGEWVYSEFVSADDDGDGIQQADNFVVHMLGQHIGSADNWTSVGLIQSYARSRATVQDSSPEIFSETGLADDPLINVFDMSSEEQMNDILTNLAEDNDQPPYNQDLYVGQNPQMQQVARIGTEVGAGRVGRASGFCVPFGLICIDPQEISTAYRVVINLAPGSYHGVYAERA